MALLIFSRLLLFWLMTFGLAQAYPFWGEPQPLPEPDPKDKILGDYLKARDALSCTNANQTCLAFYANRLQDKHAWIADDAFYYVSVQPINVVRENVDSFPLARLRRYIADATISPVRRDFYAFILGIKKHPADRTLLLDLFDHFLAAPKLAQVPMVGVMAGYALSGSSFAAPMLVKAIRLNFSATQDAPAEHANNALTAVAFLKDEFPGTAETLTAPVLKAAMQRDSQMRERALSLAQSWRDPTLTTLVWEELKRGKASDSFQQSAKAYCSEVKDQTCHLITVWFQDQETLQSIPRLAQPTATPTATPTPEVTP